MPSSGPLRLLLMIIMMNEPFIIHILKKRNDLLSLSFKIS